MSGAGSVRRRRVTYRCGNDHGWEGVGVVTVVGTLTLPSGEAVNIYQITKHPQPTHCPTCRLLYRNMSAIETGTDEP